VHLAFLWCQGAISFKTLQCINLNPPASSMARQPPHTLAILLLPLLSVMVLSTRTTYGNSCCGGTAGASARCASSPWPNSRRPACYGLTQHNTVLLTRM
jgi:hypothetical protein